MNIREIVEARKTLPLYKDAANVTYGGGRQPSLIAVMSPIAFLRVTTGSKWQYQQFLAREPEEHRPDSLEGEKYALPFLHVDRTGKVTQHDGRHRAALVARAGGTKFPVAIIFDDPQQTALPPKLFSQFMAGVSVSTADMKAGPPKPLRDIEPNISPETRAEAEALLAWLRVQPI